jgi:hypothetical protein
MVVVRNRWQKPKSLRVNMPHTDDFGDPAPAF